MYTLLLFNANSATGIQVYHGENKLIVNDMMIRSTLYYTNTFSWILYNSPWIDMDCIGGVMFGVLALSAVDRGYQSNQTL
jgi:hypothetical protein